MVDFLGGNQHTLGVAFLAERMCLDVAVTDALPRPSIPTAYSRVSVVLLVALVFLTFMLLAEPTLRKVGTAGVGTGTLWFSWHLLHLHLGIKKALQDCSHKASLCFIFFAIVIITQDGTRILSH